MSKYSHLGSKGLHKKSFLKIFKDVKAKGKEVAPRGQLVLEIENYAYTLPPYVRFPSFAARKLKLDYIKREFLWYLKGDKFDRSIVEHASMWGGLINSDGSINSNYGQYIFFGDDNQFDTVVNTLKDDKDSRRASMMILRKEHLQSDTKDVPCTYCLNFRIRDNKLNMTVRMRSQDGIFGMGNDAPCFSFTHEMVAMALKEFYPELELGEYHHSADSFHVYERHFKMLDEIVETGEFDFIKAPAISGPEEVKFLRAGEFKKIPKEFQFTKWLNKFEKVE